MILPPRFILYRKEWNATKQKWDKFPCDTQGHNIDPHAPHQWRDYDTARRDAALRDDLGVGWVLTGDGWFFLDLDKCYTEAGWSAQASAIFQSFGGALGEVSMSGTGLHVFGRCDTLALKDRKRKWDGWLEFYTEGRFVALSDTGPVVIGGGDYADRDWTDQLLRLVPEREHLGDLPDGRDESYTGPEDDDALIRMMLASSNTASKFGGGVTARDLWEANAAVLGRAYPAYDGNGPFDHSSADAALMSHLAFWTGKDMPRMDRLFRRSALVRDKYLKREDYRRDTVQGAARLCKRVYDVPRRAPSSESDAVSSEVYLNVPEMIEHFKGCVYVRDPHRVLVPDGAMLKPEQFNAVYGGHMFQMMPDGTKPTRKAFEAFTECLAHRFPQAVRPVFRPLAAPGAVLDDGSVNIYVPPTVDMTPGDVTPFLDFLSRLIPDETDRSILLAYMAGCVQNPGVKFQWAPVLQGTEGNGKTLLASCVAYAIGRQYTHQPRASQLAEKFNGYLEGKLFIIVEEIHMGGRREMLDELKPLVTNVEIEMRGMHQEKRMIENVANWFFCTNHRDAVLKSENDRRYAVFFTAQQSAEDLRRDGMDGNFFPSLYQWLRAGGYAHVAAFLRDYVIPDALNPAGSCHRAPQTTSTRHAIAASMGVIESEIVEASESDTVGFRGGWVSTWALNNLMRERGIRVSRQRLGTILTDLGYHQIGRAPRCIMREEGKKPVLWSQDAGASFDEYIVAQGPGYN